MSMDVAGIVVTIGSIILYYVSKKNRFWILTAGIGIGLLIASFWVLMIIGRAFS